MDSHLLRTAVLVSRAGSFAAVAREVGVDPSSISRQVATLEDQLGLRLFDRTTRRLDLTEAGRVYLDRAATALDVLAEAEDAARDTYSEPAGRLRVSTSVAFGERWLMPRLPAFRAQYPKIALDLTLSDAVVDLSEGGIDLAIRLGSQPEAGSVVSSRLISTRYRVVASPDFIQRQGQPDHPEALAGFDGILFQLPSFQNAWHFREIPDAGMGQAPRADAAAIEAGPKPTLTISNALAIRRAALAGMGIALLADWTIADDLNAGRLLDLFPSHHVSAGDFDTAAWFLYPSRAYVPTRLRVFIDHLRRVRGTAL